MSALPREFHMRIRCVDGWLLLVAWLLAPVAAIAADGHVLGWAKLSDTSGGVSGPTNPGGELDDADRFGGSVAALGELDGDGTTLEVAVGAYSDDDGPGTQKGAVYVLSLDAFGVAQSVQKLSDTMGDLSGAGNPQNLLSQDELFGIDATGLGDVDGDGLPDLAVGSCMSLSCLGAKGQAWVLLMDADGTVADAAGGRVKLTDGSGGGPSLAEGDSFGVAMAALGDLDGDEIPDLAIGARGDDDGGNNRGAVYMTWLAADGTLRRHMKISDAEGELSGPGNPGGLLADDDLFGFSIARLGDLDGNGVEDLAASAAGDDGGGTDRGAVWILRMNRLGRVAAATRIGDPDVPLLDGDRFGSGLASVGDLNGDGVPDLAVGAFLDDTVNGTASAGATRGAVYIVFLDADGTLHDTDPPVKIADGTTGGMPASSGGGPLDGPDMFGSRVAALGDLDGDGVMDLLVGALQDDDGGPLRGAAYVLFLDGQAAVCGNGALDPVFEECDDGNTTSGDGCSATCLDEDALFLAGTAAGDGDVSLEIEGVNTTVSPAPGDDPETVLTALAAAPDVQATHVDGDVLYTTGRLTGRASTDTGLGWGTRALAVKVDLEFEIGANKPTPVTIEVPLRQWGRTVEVRDSGGFQIGHFLSSLHLSGSAAPQPFGTMVIDAFQWFLGAASLGVLSCQPGDGNTQSMFSSGMFPFMGAAVAGPPGIRCLGYAALPGWMDPGGDSVFAHQQFGSAHSRTYSSWFYGVASWTAGWAAAGVGLANAEWEGGDLRAIDGSGHISLVAPAVIGDSSGLPSAYRFGSAAKLSLDFVPEPTSALMLIAGGAAVGMLARRRSRR
jgi:cysteine-rich repeat protein